MNNKWNAFQVKGQDTTFKTVFPVVSDDTEVKIRVRAFDE